MALAQYNSVIKTCMQGVCPAAQKGAKDSTTMTAWVSNGGFIAAGVGAFAGVVILIVQRKSLFASRPAAAAARVDAGGVSLSF
jgi:hypothetical protein